MPADQQPQHHFGTGGSRVTASAVRTGSGHKEPSSDPGPDPHWQECPCRDCIVSVGVEFTTRQPADVWSLNPLLPTWGIQQRSQPLHADSSVAACIDLPTLVGTARDCHHARACLSRCSPPSQNGSRHPAFRIPTLAIFQPRRSDGAHQRRQWSDSKRGCHWADAQAPPHRYTASLCPHHPLTSGFPRQPIGLTPTATVCALALAASDALAPAVHKHGPNGDVHEERHEAGTPQLSGCTCTAADFPFSSLPLAHCRHGCFTVVFW